MPQWYRRMAFAFTLGGTFIFSLFAFPLPYLDILPITVALVLVWELKYLCERILMKKFFSKGLKFWRIIGSY